MKKSKKTLFLIAIPVFLSGALSTISVIRIFIYFLQELDRQRGAFTSEIGMVGILMSLIWVCALLSPWIGFFKLKRFIERKEAQGISPSSLFVPIFLYTLTIIFLPWILLVAGLAVFTIRLLG